MADQTLRPIELSSKDFVAQCKAAIDANEGFVVIVRRGSWRRPSVRRGVEELQGKISKLAVSVIDKVLALKFWVGVSSAVVNRWDIQYISDNHLFVYVRPRHSSLVLLYYEQLLQQFLSGAIQAKEFKSVYLKRFKQEDQMDEPLYQVLDELFGDADSFTTDPELLAENPKFYLDEDGFREKARKAAAGLAALKASGAE